MTARACIVYVNYVNAYSTIYEGGGDNVWGCDKVWAWVCQQVRYVLLDIGDYLRG